MSAALHLVPATPRRPHTGVAPAGPRHLGLAPVDEEAWLDRVFAPDALGATFQRVREIGRGGMGIVVLARDRVLHRAVAVKLLRPTLAADARAVERFRREARIQAQLEHAGVAPLLAAGEVALGGGALGAPTRAPYLVMRHVAGESLAERLRRGGALRPAEARRLLGEVAAALAHAHGRGVVHRDLKPENVLLEADAPDAPARAVLTDFGVAARPSHDDPRTADHAAGTPHYMAPEQVAGEHAVDGRTDVYALGALGVAMLTGRAPFAGRTHDVAAAHLAAPVPDVRALAPGAPRDLSDALARCLAKDPAERWPSAQAFAAAIAGGGWRRWLTGRGEA